MKKKNQEARRISASQRPVRSPQDQLSHLDDKGFRAEKERAKLTKKLKPPTFGEYYRSLVWQFH